MPRAIPRATGCWPSPTGVGIGVKEWNLAALLELPPAVDYLEVISEHFLHTLGLARERLRDVRRAWPVHLHGLAMNIASTDPLDRGYLRALGTLVREVEPFLVSDHLSWAAMDGRPTYDLLPFPFTARALSHVAERIDAIQSALKRPIAIENPSTYVRFAEDEMEETEFLAALLRRTGAQLLFDVNNLFVNAANHGFDACAALGRLSPASVAAYHLAGHRRVRGFLLDTHDGPVVPQVYALFDRAVEHLGARPTTLEWDARIPPLGELVAKAQQIRPHLGEVARAA